MKVYFNLRQISWFVKSLGKNLESYRDIAVFLVMTGPYKKWGTFFVTVKGWYFFVKDKKNNSNYITIFFFQF